MHNELNYFLFAGAFGNNIPTLIQLLLLANLVIVFCLSFSQLISAEKARDEAQVELSKYTEVTIAN